MKLKIYDFEIEEDRNSFILTEFWEIKNKDWEIRYWEKNQTYPSTLERCFEKILHTYKKNKNITLELDEYLKEITKINNEFLEELRKIIK